MMPASCRNLNISSKIFGGVGIKPTIIPAITWMPWRWMILTVSFRLRRTFLHLWLSRNLRCWSFRCPKYFFKTGTAHQFQQFFHRRTCPRSLASKSQKENYAPPATWWRRAKLLWPRRGGDEIIGQQKKYFPDSRQDTSALSSAIICEELFARIFRPSISWTQQKSQSYGQPREIESRRLYSRAI